MDMGLNMAKCRNFGFGKKTVPEKKKFLVSVSPYTLLNWFSCVHTQLARKAVGQSWPFCSHERERETETDKEKNMYVCVRE
jgi:hypothetical protein